jgi:hypothetical protein
MNSSNSQKLLSKPESLFLLVLIFQWAFLFTIHTPAWDAAFYYAYSRSLVFDLDLDIENDLILSYLTTAPDFAARRLDQERTVTGRIVLPFAIGSSLLWVPWLFILRITAGLTHFFLGYPATLTGYEWVFLGGVATLSMFMGWLAFWIAFRLARQEFGQSAAFTATLTLMFTTPLLFYQFRDPFYSHTASAFISTLCVYVWWRGHDKLPSLSAAVLLGVLIGLAALVRWQHLLYMVLPLAAVAGWWLSLPHRERHKQGLRPILYLSIVALATLALFSIQLVLWRIFYGSWITVPQGSAFMEWTAPYLRPTLMSTYKGLFTWMPVALPAVVGLILLAWRRPRLAIPLLIVLLLEIYVNSSTRDWFGGGGFGPRRFTGQLALFTIGYACLLHAFFQRGRTLIIAATPIALLLGLHQWILLRYGLVERLGGHNLSMAPDYRWSDLSWLAFINQLSGYAPAAISQPADFFILPGSPLHQLFGSGVLPLPHLLTLAMTGMFLLLVLRLPWWLRSGGWRSRSQSEKAVA